MLLAVKKLAGRQYLRSITICETVNTVCVDVDEIVRTELKRFYDL